VALAHNEATGGAKGEQVAGLKHEAIAGNRQETVIGDKHASVEADWDVEVAGHAVLKASGDSSETIGESTYVLAQDECRWLAKRIKIATDKLSIFVNGKLAVRVEKSGKVQVLGRTITVDDSP
jgi:type VI secretion system secreted protein VgrG